MIGDASHIFTMRVFMTQLRAQFQLQNFLTATLAPPKPWVDTHVSKTAGFCAPLAPTGAWVLRLGGSQHREKGRHGTAPLTPWHHPWPDRHIWQSQTGRVWVWQRIPWKRPHSLDRRSRHTGSQQGRAARVQRERTRENEGTDGQFQVLLNDGETMEILLVNVNPCQLFQINCQQRNS